MAYVLEDVDMPNPTVPIDPAAVRRHAERFHGKAKLDPETGCMNWTAYLTAWGYGQFKIEGRSYIAHRVAYVLDRQEDIPPGLEVDHLCRNTACVNPRHLRAVTGIENTMAGTSHTAETMRAFRERGECRLGHDLTSPDAWRMLGGSNRQCRRCANDWQLAKYHRLRAIAA